MSTITGIYTDVIRVQRARRVQWIMVLTAICLILITVAILTMVSSTIKDQNAIQADLIPVVKNSITPIPVLTPPPSENLAIPSETPATASQDVHERIVLSVPVPTPPS